MAESRLTRMHPSIHRKKKGRIAHTITARKGSRGNKKPKREKKQVRGKEVAIRQNLSPAEILYGRMRTGGIYTFIETNSNSKASLTVGSGNSQIVFIAKNAGASGNLIRIEVVVPVSQGSIVINNGTNAIQIVNKSTGSTPTGTANQIIAAIRADTTANALVDVHNGEGDGSGTVGTFASTYLSGGGGTWLHQVITLGGHEIDAVESLYLGERLVTFGASPDSRWAINDFSGRCFMAIMYGTDSQAAQPDLVAQLPAKWTSNHRQRGCAHAYVILVWDANTFPEGLPDLNFLVRGKKCYDPRSATTVWTQNAALIIADYLMDTRIGLSVPLAQIDSTTFTAAADVCDEAVSIAAGGTEPRYTINGVFDSDMTPQEVLTEMAQAIGGDIVYQGGKWYIYPAKYRSPSVTLTEQDLVGDLRVVTKVSRSDSFNSVRGTYVSPSDNYNERDFPAVKNSTYIAEDQGVQVWEDLALDFVTSATQCQRLAKIELERVRQGIELTWPCSPKALQLGVCDTVYVTLAKYGWSAKVFEVRDIQLGLDPENGVTVDLLLRETASGVFDWSSGEETTIDLSPNTNLPSPYSTAAPTGLTLESGTNHLYIRADGTVFSRLWVGWDAGTDIHVISGGRHELMYKRQSGTEWQMGPIVSGDSVFAYILDVQDGDTYVVRVRAVNSIGTESAWTTSAEHVVIGKTAPPSDVTSFDTQKQDYGIYLAWTAIPDLDVRDYEIRVGASWDLGAVIARVAGTSYLWEFRVAGTYQLWIKSRDTSDNYATNALGTTITINSPSSPMLTYAFSGPNVILSWAPSTGDFAIASYEVRYGTDFETGVSIGVAAALNLLFRVDWGGNRTFWVAARDVAGNLGAAESIVVMVNDPNGVNSLSASVVDNNVLIDWTEPNSSTLPVEKYKIYKGVTFGGADLLGTAYGTFHTYVETSGGTYTYWVVAIDTAGNEGPERDITATVQSPRDYELIDDQFPPLSSATGSNYVVVVDDPDSPVIIAPVDGSETWSDWWDNNSWTTWQDAIDDFPQYLQPAVSDGFIEFEIDYGVVLSQSYIEWSWSETILDGTPTITPQISISEDAMAWTDYPGESTLFAGTFQYVRYRLDIHAPTDLDLVILYNMRAKISLRLDEETGTATCNDTDTGGTTVTFVKAWLDVRDIQVQVLDTNARFGVVNFDDVPNPTSFKVLIFDIDGNRRDGNVFYRVKGALA